MWPTFAALSLQYVILARVLLSAGEFDAYRVAFPFFDLHVVRLEAPDAELYARLAAREPGVSLDFLMHLAPAMADEMRANDLDEFVIKTAPTDPSLQSPSRSWGLLGWPHPSDTSMA